MGHTGSEVGGRKANDNYVHGLAFYELVMNSLPAGVITVSAELRITGFNPWAQKLTGYEANEAIGRFCGDILQGGMCRANCPLKAALDSLKPVSLLETTIRNRWGENIPVRMSTAAMFDERGRLIGAVESFQDISRIKKLERERNNLISMFAHDMKSSLSIIGGFVLRLLKKGKSVEEIKQRKYLNIVKSEANKLESLINSFLDFSRLLEGKLKLNFTATALDKDLIELVDAYAMKAANAGIVIEYQSEEPLSIIMGDSQHLRRVFTNLLDNAIKFSKEKGRIILSTEETATEVIVRVKDEGIGIAPEELPYIFDAFTRGRDTESNAGFGLGLAGAKRIVQGHGGHIQVTSELGVGSTFTVFLPKAGSRQENP